MARKMNPPRPTNNDLLKRFDWQLKQLKKEKKL